LPYNVVAPTVVKYKVNICFPESNARFSNRRKRIIRFPLYAMYYRSIVLPVDVKTDTVSANRTIERTPLRDRPVDNVLFLRDYVNARSPAENELDVRRLCRPGLFFFYFPSVVFALYNIYIYTCRIKILITRFEVLEPFLQTTVRNRDVFDVLGS